MEQLRYKGRNIYLNYTRDRVDFMVNKVDKAKTGVGVIEDAYFFDFNADSARMEVPFNKRKVENGEIGLYVEVNGGGSVGTAAVSMTGLEKILNFLADVGVFTQNVEELNGKRVVTYDKGRTLLGIGLPINVL